MRTLSSICELHGRMRVPSGDSVRQLEFIRSSQTRFREMLLNKSVVEKELGRHRLFDAHEGSDKI